MDKLLGFCRRHPMLIISSASFILLAAIIYKEGYVRLNGDSDTYIMTWEEQTSHGQIDHFRTPAYPLLIGIGQMLLGKAHYWIFVVVFQIAVFYLSALTLSKMILAVIKRRRIAWLTVALLFLFVPIIKFLRVIGTEAMAFSLTALFIYCTWRFLQRPRWKYGIAIALLATVGVMLRPSMLILIAATAALATACFFARKHRRTGALLLIAIIPVSTVCHFYANGVEKITHVRTISTVSIFNRFYIAREGNEIYPEYLDNNPEAIALMEKYQNFDDVCSHSFIKARWDEMLEGLGNGIWNYEQMDTYCDLVRANHPEVWYKNILKNIAVSWRDCDYSGIWFYYLILGLYAAAFAVSLIRRRTLSLINLLTLAIGGGSMLSVFLFSQNNFARLMLPTAPAIILMAGQLTGCVFLRPRLHLSLRDFTPETDSAPAEVKLLKK